MSKILRDSRLIEPTEQEEANYTNLLSSEEVIHLYRGIDLVSLMKMLKVKIVRPDPETVLEDLAIKLFAVGAKSNYYIGRRSRVDRHNIHNQVEDVDEHAFVKLGNKLNSVFFNNENEKRSVANFNDKNPLFATELRRFNPRRLAGLNHINKVLIRDYYLALLHQIYDKKYHLGSALISTTTDENIAEKFRGPDSAEGILIKYFVPREKVFTLTVPPYFLVNGPAIDLIRQEGLPLVTTPPYKEQQEYSARRALFPHFISSFSYINEHEVITILNPEMSDYSRDTLQNGFNINQENFFEIVRGTNFERQGGLRQDGSFTEFN